MKNIQCSNCSQEISRKAPTCPKCGHPNKVAHHVSSWQVLFTLGMCFVVIWWLATSDSPPVSGGANSANTPDPKSVALSNIELKNLRWSKEGFGNVMQLSVTLINKGQRDVKDIELKCEHFSNSGTRIDSNKRIIYEIIPAGKSKTIKEFGMGFIHNQATKTGCHISDLVLM
ncbi:hypothetical protein [Azonexus hydrophilus]|uniref:Zinc-ribbon domain-containing protein n=1 Tax=Azonexus hydrophilus TaxID=418702 RepID=A0ABZ2XGH2_9RHOO